jgi:hypothetical protein
MLAKDLMVLDNIVFIDQTNQIADASMANKAPGHKYNPLDDIHGIPYADLVARFG